MLESGALSRTSRDVHVRTHYTQGLRPWPFDQVVAPCATQRSLLLRVSRPERAAPSSCGSSVSSS
jgi:hypothetical protein